MRITKNFTLDELTRSYTADKYKIDNTPSEDVIKRLTKFTNLILQPLRDYLGYPIHISSGYRSIALNKLIGGSKTSQHCKGEAADIKQDIREQNKEVFEYISKFLEFDQLIWEFGDKNSPSWVHVSFDYEHNNRRQKLIAKRINGKTKYYSYSKERLNQLYSV